jgi:putative pyruvate formate lyase activating enzyme
MRCSFCQNGDISTDKSNGILITPDLLALMIWQLRMEGCHNTNWVGGDPTIHLYTIVQAISVLDSFRMPNTNIKKGKTTRS